MILYLRDGSDTVQDTVQIGSIANDASFARYKDTDGYPYDTASGPFYNPADWYEEPSSSTTKGSANTSTIPELESIILPILLLLLFIGLINDRKIWIMHFKDIN